jgi:hypothetical protein
MTTPDPDAYESDWADLAHRKWAEYQRLVQRFEAGDTSASTAIDLRERALAKLVPDLADEIDKLRDADGLARDALRRAGYHFSTDSDKPLAELIEKLNTDARDVVASLGETGKRLRAVNERLTALTARLHAVAEAARNGGVSLDPAEVLGALDGDAS